MRALSFFLVLLAGCATVSKTVKGPEGYKYIESITAVGGGNIEKATQSFGGTLKVYNEDGSVRVEVELDSAQEGEGTTSDAEAILAVVNLLGNKAVP
jgi:starvation-inducible outer membrane lipoprotein